MAAPAPWAQSVNGALRKVPTWPVYVAGFGWMAWLFWRGLTDFSLIEPIDWLERSYGLVAIQLLCATLAVTPIRRFLGLNLLRFRRSLGQMVFFFVLAHLLVWALLDVRAWGAVWADIVKRPYVTIGMAAFLLLIPLALTSTDAMVRRLGGMRWRRLHWLTYGVAVLGAVHYLWLSRVWAGEPVLYTALLAGLLALRLPWGRLAPARA